MDYAIDITAVRSGGLGKASLSSYIPLANPFPVQSQRTSPCAARPYLGLLSSPFILPFMILYAFHL